MFQVKPGTTIERIKMLLKKSNMAIAQYKWVRDFAITEAELPQTSARKIKHYVVREMLDNGAFTRAGK